MADIRDFYGKKHLGKPIRITGPGVAHVARYPTVSAGFWWRTISAGVDRELLRVVLRGQRLVTELLLRKDGGMAGYIRDRHEDLRGHGGMCVYRRWAIAETGWL